MPRCAEPPFPIRHSSPSARSSTHLTVIRRERSLFRLLEGPVPWRHGFAVQLGTATAPKEVVDGVKNEWTRQVEAFTDGIYPEWRTHFDQKRRRVPPDIRREFKPEARWAPQDSYFVESFLRWLGAKPEPQLLSEMTARLDAVVRFTRFVVRQFVIGEYSLAQNDSDVFDQFQLPPPRARWVRDRD